MIRMLGTFAWLRWKLLTGALLGGRNRDALERVSRAAALLVPTALLVLTIGVSLGAGVLGLAAGWVLGAREADRDVLLLLLRAGLLAALVTLAVSAATSASRASVTAHPRLRLLPIRHATLHLADALAGLADPFLLYLVPMLLLLPVGLLSSGRLGPSAVALAAGVGLLAVLLSAASALSQLAAWLFRSRRRAETLTLVFVTALTLGSVVPALLGDRLERRREDGRRVPIGESLAQALPRWIRALPSELYGAALGRGMDGDARDAWLAAAALAAQAAVLYGVSSAIHRRVLETAETGGRSRSRGFRAARDWRLPGLPAAASAVALATARTALRSVRGRTVVLLPGPLLLVFGILARKMPDEIPGGHALAHGDLLLGAGAVFVLYAMQAFTMNQFGADRAGLTLQLLSPLSDLHLVLGKAAGSVILLAITLVPCLACALAIAPGGSPLSWVSVLLGAVATHALLAPVGAALSAVFPVASDLSKTGSGGNPHGLAMLVGTGLVLTFSAPGAAILLVVTHGLGRPGLGLLLMAAWTVVCVAVSVPLLRLAARAVGPRRENLALVAQAR